MTVWLYSNIRNESLRLPYWLRHYATFVDKIIVYDDNSDDGSVELMLNAGVEVRPCPWTGIDDVVYASFASHQYKEARGQADWVFWVDGDEFIYHPYMREYLEYLTQTGVTLPITRGYTMFADAPPTGNGQIYEEIRRGVPDHRYGKSCVINPDIELVWGPGRHEITTDFVTRDEDSSEPLKLLHYRWLGEAEFLDRNAKIWAAVSDRNIAFGLGANSFPNSTATTHTLPWYRSLMQQAVDCV